MFKNQNRLSFSSAVLVMVVLINASIITTAYLYNADFYWALPFSLPALGFAIYYWRMVTRRSEADRKQRAVDYDLNDTAAEIAIGDTERKELTTLLGNKQCAQPYQTSIISFECTRSDLSLDSSPKHARISDDDDERIVEVQSVNDHLPINHIWRIATDYEGCRDHNFQFSTEAFGITALQPNVKMIELELNHFDTGYSSVTGNRITGSSRHDMHPDKKDNRHNHNHTAFGNADSMSIFLDSLRELSDKKPVGISLSISDKKDFHEMCFAFRKTGIIPDYLVIHDGIKKDEFHFEPHNKLSLGLYEALLFASKTLELYGLQDDIKIVAASEIYSPFDVLRLFALGSDVVRIKNHTPCTGGKSEHPVHSETTFSQSSLEFCRREILNDTLNLMQVMGYSNVKDITLAGLLRDVDALYSTGFYEKFRGDNSGKLNREKSIIRPKSQSSSGKKTYSVIKEDFKEKNADFEILN
ncbi:MAG: hypothetical protein ABIO82_02600 [Ginsengibacter sp.]